MQLVSKLLAVTVVGGALGLVGVEKAVAAAAPLKVAPLPTDEELTKEERCFLKVLCETKKKIQYRHDVWDSAQCSQIGRQFIKSARKHDFKPAFLSSIAVHESDLRENVMRPTITEMPFGPKMEMRKVEIAHDGGLMQVRCVHSPILVGDVVKKSKELICKNAYAWKLPLAQVMQPLDTLSKDEKELPGNIEIGAQELAAIRKGVPLLVNTKVREKGGRIRVIRKIALCDHKLHWWVRHYNSGQIVDPKKGKFYGNSVASIYHALAAAVGSDTPEMKNAVLYIDSKGRKRRADEPLTPRHKELYARIMTCRGTCNQVASAVPIGVVSQ